MIFIALLHPILIACLLFLFGACVGSFADVIRTRKSWRKSFAGRSYCAGCRKTLTWRELVPIVSYLSLRGTCSSCSAPIPMYHLASEVLMGLLFVSAFLFSGSLYGFGIILLSAVFLVPVVLSDVERFEVPEHLSIPFSFLSLGIATAVMLQTGSVMPVVNGILLAAPFFLMWRCSGGRAMGLGDAKIAVSLGFLLPHTMAAVSVFIYTFWLGTLGVLVYAAYMKVRTGTFGVTRRMHMPLIPSMVTAYFFVLFTDFTVVSLLSVV